jgi:hypothetical protein
MAKQRDAKEQSERLFTAEVANIERVVLDNENGHFVLERRGDKTEAKAKAEAKEKEPGEWWLVEPISARADREQVDPMLENLRGAKRRNSFAPKAGGLAAYGLEKTRRASRTGHPRERQGCKQSPHRVRNTRRAKLPGLCAGRGRERYFHAERLFQTPVR